MSAYTFEELSMEAQDAVLAGLLEEIQWEYRRDNAYSYLIELIKQHCGIDASHVRYEVEDESYVGFECEDLADYNDITDNLEKQYSQDVFLFVLRNFSFPTKNIRYNAKEAYKEEVSVAGEDVIDSGAKDEELRSIGQTRYSIINIAYDFLEEIADEYISLCNWLTDKAIEYYNQELTYEEIYSMTNGKLYDEYGELVN